MHGKSCDLPGDFDDMSASQSLLLIRAETRRARHSIVTRCRQYNGGLVPEYILGQMAERARLRTRIDVLISFRRSTVAVPFDTGNTSLRRWTCGRLIQRWLHWYGGSRARRCPDRIRRRRRRKVQLRSHETAAERRRKPRGQRMRCPVNTKLETTVRVIDWFS